MRHKITKYIKRAASFALGALVVFNTVVTPLTVKGGAADVQAAEKKTIKEFLKTGLEPMGTTMYTYGGGWNEEDTGAGTEARTIGLSARWAEFAAQQTSSYNYKDYDYKKNGDVIHLGLDCSGYVGWVLYNTLETENGKEGYVDYNNKVLERLQITNLIGK